MSQLKEAVAKLSASNAIRKANGGRGSPADGN